MQSSAQPAASPNSSPEAVIHAAVQRLTSQYNAQGDLELYMIRQIAAFQLTVESLQRNIDHLLLAADPDDVRIDRLSRSQARTHRMELNAIRELKALQDRRAVQLRFPEQTNSLPPLADHLPFVGFRPQIEPLPKLRRTKPALTPHDLVNDPEFLAKHAPQLLKFYPGYNKETPVEPGKPSAANLPRTPR